MFIKFFKKRQTISFLIGFLLICKYVLVSFSSVAMPLDCMACSIVPMLTLFCFLHEQSEDVK